MSCLRDKSSHAILPGKRLFEYGGCEANDKSDDPGQRRISAKLEMRPPKVIGKAILVTVGPNGSSQPMYFDTLNRQDSAVDPKTLDRKYPDPNIQKEISLSQQFPGRPSPVSSPKYEVLTNGEYDVERGPLAEMKQRDNEQMGGEIYDDGSESNLEGNAFTDIADFVKTESRNLKVTQIDKVKPVGGVTHSACEQKLEDREETSNMCASRSNMLQSDLKCQMVSDNGHGAKSHVGRMGNDSARCILPVKPRVLARSELKFKATKPFVSCGEVDVTELTIPLKNMETGCSIAKRKVELENLEVNDSTLEQIDALDSSEASSKPHLLHRKYPPPKFQKGVSIFLKFPQGCGRLDNASSSKCEVLSNVKSGVDLQPLVDTIQTACENHEDGSAFAREVEGEILEDIDDELKAETGKGTEVENDKLFDLKTNLKCQTACVDGDRSQVGRIGCDSEKSIRYKLCGDKPGSVDLAPSFGGSVTGMQQGKRMSNCALTEATVGCKDKKYELMDASQSKYLNLKRDGTNVSEWSFAKEDVQYLDTVSDDSGKHCDSIVLSDSQTDLSRFKVQEALDLFKKILEKWLLNVKKVSLDTYVQAAMQLKERGKWVNMNERVLGAIPGIEIGDKFHCRAELVIIGLHRPFEAGIAFIDKDGKKIVTSIVDSGRYANETKFTGVLIYSGEGGNPAIRNKKSEDQTLVRGNLALKNSMEAGTPVRVIRGCRVWKSRRAGDGKRVKQHIHMMVYMS